ncbi:hypothetical protein L596_024419 [Steinernema carpocapsae]|uniref:Uncharacterized protein n=1 Tax=Steinernema carpocapsae TaxID=34508 RepID=A0A4U5MGM6_STECR|nr:hypothetical protein L596_024419 [Steinernema carpocapsae]
MFRFLRLFVLFAVVTTRLASACGAGGIGGGGVDDNRIIQNPTLDFEINPPVAWTYPEATAQNEQSFFAGQSLTQGEANNKAMGDLEAAALSAIVDAGLPTEGVKVRSNYNAQEISDCRKSQAGSAIGSRIGVVESGAVVRVMTLNMALPSAMCQTRTFITAGGTMNPTFSDYYVTGSIQIENLTVTRFQLRQIARGIMLAMNFRYSAHSSKIELF